MLKISLMDWKGVVRGGCSNDDEGVIRQILNFFNFYSVVLTRSTCHK